MPLGGYKGYALALLVEVLSGVLSGSGVGHGIGASERASRRTSGTSTWPSTSSGWPAASAPRELLARLLGDLKAVPPAPGFDEVLLPGEPEQRTQAERERDGIPLPPTLFTTLTELSAELGVSGARRRVSPPAGRRLFYVDDGRGARRRTGGSRGTSRARLGPMPIKDLPEPLPLTRCSAPA